MKTLLLFAACLLICTSGFSQNVGIGITSPLFKLDVREGSINTDSVYRIGTKTVLSARGTDNLFVGKNAGPINIGINNTFCGDQAGFSSSSFSSSNNSFFGQGAGYSNTDGAENSFFGQGAGYFNVEGSYNSFYGRNAGFINVSGYSNSFFGADAGKYTVSGELNSFFGAASGRSNSTGNSNSFFGTNAGLVNNTGHFNSFFGINAGRNNTTGTRNTAVGDSANVYTGALTNATALGARSRVDCSNCMVLGSVNTINGAISGVNVGIGVNSPNARLSISSYGTELVGTAASTLVRTNAGILGNLAGDEMSLANIGFASSNNSSLGIRAYRRIAGTDWTSTALLIGYDVDNTPRAGGGFLAISANGNIGIGTMSPHYTLDVIGNSAKTGNFLNTGTNGTAVAGISLNTAGQGVGVYGAGGNVGVEGVADLPGDGNRFGVSGQGHNSNYYNYGVKGDATGGINAYGVFGSASGAFNSYGVYGSADGISGYAWAGYFNGDLIATNRMGIGTNNPQHKLDVANGSINTDSTYCIEGINVLSVRGVSNLFVGPWAGRLNTTGYFNSFFGEQAGFDNTTGSENSFFGPSAGYSNSTGSTNSFYGLHAAYNNASGSENTAHGSFALLANFTGTRNTAVGFHADVNTGALTNATAIGAHASVNCSNCMVLGSVINVNGAAANVNVGIGINAPDATLHVARGTGGFGTAAFHGTNHISHFNFSGPENTFIRAGKDNGIVFINDIPGGKVIIGTGSGEKLTVNGDIWTCGNITAAGYLFCSDIRYKTNLSPLSNSLDKILQLHGINYDWKREEFKEKNFSDKRQIGFSAQELEKLIPEIVQTDAAGYKSVDYSRMTPILVEAIKEQQQQIADQQRQIDELKKLVLELAAIK